MTWTVANLVIQLIAVRLHVAGHDPALFGEAPGISILKPL